MIVRILVLAMVVISAFALVWASERWKGKQRSGLAPGMLLVTAAGCALCLPAEQALISAGVRFRKVDAADVPDLGVRSVPTLFVVGGDGDVVARRSGRAAVLSTSELVGWRY